MIINNVVIVGKFKCIDKKDDEYFILNIVINDDKRIITIPIYLSSLIAKHIKENCSTESIIGIKGKVNIKNNNICIIATKISLLINNSNK